MNSLTVTSGPTVVLIDVEHLIDYPWMTATRIRYNNGSRYDFTFCEDTECDDIELFHNAILPPDHTLLEVRETDTLPNVANERTAIYWVME